jgi:EPS-associated MarR family transcriptional regulator
MRCNVSLGSIHYCLSALIEKGFIKAKNFKNSKNKLAYSYILTPSGFAHKHKITKEFLKRKQVEFELIKDEIAKLEGELKQTSQKI